ncbi:hypothetical protein T4D_12702 [Trichinella pseudospiralis]|uniref:Uncharacterized protein n=1 Tax=Trichinella pseudospiralis TaxID=6337 RepID=A0A0V1ECY9_TRIPS|nr:hypothetical protein T4D_12702 [Trichinella pseudospiralis]
MARKMKNVEKETQTMTWNSAKKLKYMQNEKHKLEDLEYGKKP